MGSGAFNAIAHQDLASVGLRKFVHELNTGRMIAFLGSGATVNHGYPKWNDEFVKAYWNSIQNAVNKPRPLSRTMSGPSKEDVAKETHKNEVAKAIIKGRRGDVTLTLDLLDSLYGVSRDSGDPKLFEKIRKTFAERFSPESQRDIGGALRVGFPDIDELPPDQNILQVLFSRLFIRRVMTLNYDVEAEIAFLRRIKKCPRDRAVEFWKQKREEFCDKVSGDVTIDLPSGYRLSSLIVHRDRTDKLVEFALGAPDRKISILHLHGREDRPETIIASKRDYRDLYWRKDLSKPLVEQGLKAIFIGNPILHIGIGMNEADVTRTLEQFMSDTPLDVEFPRFILKETLPTEAENDALRLKMFHDFGVYTIFDLDLKQVIDGIRPAIKTVDDDTRSEWISKTMVEAVRNSSDVKDRINENYKKIWDAENFCSQNPQLNGDDGFPKTKTGMQIWKAATEPDLTTHEIFWYDQSDDSGRLDQSPRKLYSGVYEKDGKRAVRDHLLSAPLSALIASPGTGKGLISRIIHNAAQQEDSGSGAHRSVLINAAFAMETDGIFSILTGTVTGRTAAERKKSRRDAFQAFLNSDVARINASIKEAEGPPTQHLTVIVNGMERFLSDDGEPLSIEVDNFFRQYVKRLQQVRQKIENDHSNNNSPEDEFFLKLVVVGTNRVRRYLQAISDIPPPIFDVRKEKDDDGHRVLSIGLADTPVGEDSRTMRLFIAEHSKTGANYFSTLINAARQRSEDRRHKLPSLDLNETDCKAEKESLKLVKLRLGKLSAGLTYTDRKSRRTLLMYLLSADTLRLPSSAIQDSHDISTDLCLLIIRTLAFVGQPTDRCIFNHILLIIDFDRGPDDNRVSNMDQKARIASHIDHLIECQLILELAPFDRSNVKEKRRVALHKSVLAEMRERYGIPLSDARMTNSFNLTLYAAQPAEGYVPETKWHSILEDVAANLVNAYRDEMDNTDQVFNLMGDRNAQDIIKKELECELNKAGHINVEAQHIPRLATREMAACLRSAYLLIRSYYSSASMIMLTDQTQSSPSELKKLARRLKRLIDVAEQHIIIRNHLISRTQDDLAPKLLKALGKPAFYPDDLVWIYNEIGVIEMLLGRLYRSEDVLTKAHHINDKFVEFERRQINWRFLETNMLQVRLNRGRLQDLDHSLRELRESIEASLKDFHSGSEEKEVGLLTNDQTLGPLDPLDHVVQAYGVDGIKTPARIDRHMPRDLILNTALYMGYRAVHETISGSFGTALQYFENCATITNRIGERRAYSLFQSHNARLLNQIHREKEAMRVVQLAINASGSIRQADINRFSRTLELNWSDTSNPNENSRAIPALKEALSYARQSDNYTLQIQALRSLADQHRNSGDFDSAVAADTDAIALSARFGHGLRKILLRVSLAKDYCLPQEDHLRQSALALTETAARIGTNVGYSTLVDRAQTTKVDIMSGKI